MTLGIQMGYKLFHSNIIVYRSQCGLLSYIKRTMIITNILIDKRTMIIFIIINFEVQF